MTHFAAPASTSFAPARRSKLRVWHLIELYRQRKDLAKLSEHQLRDIGVTQSEALSEAKRFIWDAPNHWVQ